MSEYKTSEVCRLLGVSRSEYYRTGKELDSEEKALEKEVIHCFRKHKGNYGRIRIRKELLGEGKNISEYRIAGILKKNGLVAKSGRTGKPRAPKPTEQQYIEENLIKNKFEVTVANYLWCSDITELKCLRSKLYVCGIIDVATRRIVGWSIAKNQTQRLVVTYLLPTSLLNSISLLLRACARKISVLPDNQAQALLPSKI